MTNADLPDATDDLTLPEAAELLGVHYMTAYRYVRSGLLKAEQHGGQWWVDRTTLDAFRAERRGAGGRRPAGRRPADAAARGDTSIDPSRAAALADRLVLGDQLGAWALVEVALNAGAGPREVYTQLLTPALRDIGDRWEAGEVSVAAEHRGSVVAMRLIGRLGVRFTRPGRTAGSVVLAAAPGDRHGLPTAILADLLRLEGLSVADLGADTPAQEIVLAATAEDRLLAVGICATSGLGATTERHLRKAIRTIHERVGCPVLVGGAALRSAELAERLGADHWSGSTDEATTWFAGVASQAPAQPPEASA